MSARVLSGRVRAAGRMAEGCGAALTGEGLWGSVLSAGKPEPMASKVKKKVLVVFGTRPEAIKLAPVIRELKRSRRLSCLVCSTGQHGAMAEQVRGFFGFRVDFDLGVMRPRQDLEYLTAAVTRSAAALLDRARPDRVVVQGDTTTAFLVALAAFYRRIPVAHVEAGLRTGDRYYPFPEEMNRLLISDIADLHFAPTAGARDNLLREGIPPKSVFVTGNTGIDALLWARSILPARFPRLGAIDSGRKIVLATAHRRESFGRPLEDICRAFADIVRADPAAEVVYPVHPNPSVRETADAILKGVKGVRLLPPVSYGELVFLMTRCRLILTDSGGIQEEAPSLGKPVLVMRDETERPEGVALGVARLVGRRRGAIVRETLRLLSSTRAYRAMQKGVNPYGDGRAAARIRRVIEGAA